MQGKDLTRIILDEEPSRRDGVLVEQMTTFTLPGDDFPTRVKTFVDRDWRLSYFSTKEWGELYDLKNDPGEIVNLWASPDHRTVRLELMEHAMKEMVANESLSPIQINVG